jgi:hypothetical protein
MIITLPMPGAGGATKSGLTCIFLFKVLGIFEFNNEKLRNLNLKFYLKK